MKNKIFTIVMVLGVIIAGLEVGFLYSKRDKLFPPKPKTETVSAATSTLNFFVNELDGTKVDLEKEIYPDLIGVMIDNHPLARPQSGLAQARVVYEVPVEGSLTRFFAIFFASDSVARVGPVRSARPYFLDWFSEMGNISYWHSGGSPEALDLIKQKKIWDVNEFYFGPYFWRSSEREAPHNLYTAGEKWRLLTAGTPHENKAWEGWLFAPILGTEFRTESVLDLQITYYSGYTVGWQFNPETGQYYRKIGGEAVADDTGASISADTILVQEVDAETIDEEGRQKITTDGQGRARVLRDGKMIRATWEKSGQKDRTRFYDSNGKEIPLRPGKIWIEVIAQNTPLEVSN